MISGWKVWTLNLMNQPIKIQYKPPKLLSQRIRKCSYKTLGTSVINSSMSPSSLVIMSVSMRQMLDIRGIIMFCFSGNPYRSSVALGNSHLSSWIMCSFCSGAKAAGIWILLKFIL